MTTSTVNNPAGAPIVALRMPPAVAEPYIVLFTVPGAPIVTCEQALELLHALLPLEPDIRAIVANDEEQRTDELRQRAQ